jgi:glutamate formiminotransferase
MDKIMECVPNFSEGRDAQKIERIAAPFRGKKNVRLLDVQSDEDHHRMVVTVVGEPEALKAAVAEAVAEAVACIDMTVHKGQHPRMGAVDVIPFIPVKNMEMEEAVRHAREVAEVISEKHALPVFLYEAAAACPERVNLAAIRKGEFEGLPEKLKQPEWRPDYGLSSPHPTAGATVVGARMPLVAFNVNLDTNRIEIADDIARKVRHISGGLRYCKGIGIELKERKQVQVSMNMTHYQKTALYTVFELIRSEARRYGVNIAGSEIIGLVPMEALVDTTAYYLGLEEFSLNQILESRLLED